MNAPYESYNNNHIIVSRLRNLRMLRNRNIACATTLRYALRRYATPGRVSEFYEEYFYFSRFCVVFWDEIVNLKTSWLLINFPEAKWRHWLII